MKTISARRRLYALLVLPFVLLLAGCGRLHADFEITSIDSMELAFDMGFTPSFIEGEFDNSEQMCADFEDDDSFGEVDVTPYEEDGMWGCRFTGVVERSDFGSGMTLTEEDGEFHFSMEMGDSAITQDDLDLFATMYGADVSEFDFQITFAFPGEVLSSTGGTVDGKTVTYTDIAEFSEGVDITAEAGGGFPWLLVIGIVLVLGFLLLLAIAVVVFFVIRSRRAKNSGSGGSPSAYAAPAAFGAAGAAPQGGQGAPQWGQGSPAAPQGDQGQQWGQGSPAAPQGAPQWGQPSPAAPQGDQGQQWGQGSPAAPQGAPQWGQPSPAPQGDQGQPWSQPPSQQPGDGQQNPQGGNQPPQNPGW